MPSSNGVSDVFVTCSGFTEVKHQEVPHNWGKIPHTGESLFCWTKLSGRLGQEGKNKAVEFYVFNPLIPQESLMI